MTVAELRKKLEHFGPGREVLIRMELHGYRPVDVITLCEHEEKVIIHGKHIPAADIRFPG